MRFHNKAVQQLNQEYMRAKDEYAEQQKSVVVEVVNIAGIVKMINDKIHVFVVITLKKSRVAVKMFRSV